jgi:hypothetical protein
MQDQKALRVTLATVTANMTASGNSIPQQRILDADTTFYGYGYLPSDQPFNCRVRYLDDLHQKRYDLGDCSHPAYQHCSILHGHDLALVNLRTQKLQICPAVSTKGYSSRRSLKTEKCQMPVHFGQGDVLVIPEIPHTGSACFTAVMLSPLSAVFGSLQSMKLDISTIIEHALDSNSATAIDTSTDAQSATAERRTQIFFGPGAVDVCRWFTKSQQANSTIFDFFGFGKIGRCLYATMLRDPIDRLLAEFNHCDKVGWINGEPACTGSRGASDFQGIIERIRAEKPGVPGEPFVAFAKHRRNVLLEHIAPPLDTMDYLQSGAPRRWEKRDPRHRVNALDNRARRMGSVSESDLALAKIILASQYAAVGVYNMPEETCRAFTVNFATKGKISGDTNQTLALCLIKLNAIIAQDDTIARVGLQRKELTVNQLKRIFPLVRLDVKLFKFASNLVRHDSMRDSSFRSKNMKQYFDAPTVKHPEIDWGTLRAQEGNKASEPGQTQGTSAVLNPNATFNMDFGADTLII